MIATERQMQEIIAEEWLLYFPVRRARVMEAREELLYASPRPPDGGGGTTTSDTTLNKAVRLAGTWDGYKWVCAVECCIAEWKQNHPQWVRLLEIRWEVQKEKHKVGRPGWVDRVIDRFYEETDEAPHPTTVKNYWRAMKSELAWYALSRGCYK